jgi:hypothetical protein
MAITNYDKKKGATVTSNGKVNKSEHTHFQLPPTKNFLTIVEWIVFSDENETGNREKRERRLLWMSLLDTTSALPVFTVSEPIEVSGTSFV